MSAHEVMETACRAVMTVAAGAADCDLAGPTPGGWTIRELVDHFAGTTGALARVGRRLPLAPDDPWGSTVTVMSGDWFTTLTDRLADLSASWRPATAWAGTVTAAGPAMPATMLGEIALIEVVLHGWDLARATGQDLRLAPAAGAEVLRSVSETAELGRQMGAYGPAVEVSTSAPDLDRALGASGRNPAWLA